MITKHHLQKLQEEEEKRIADAFKRAKKIIHKQGLNDDYMLARMEGKNIGGTHGTDFVVLDSEAVWIMMENKVSTDDILDIVYTTKGKMTKTEYIKKKEKDANK